MKKKKIYCAGPLFNRKEKEEMQEIADILENYDYEVFLPHRDGIEFATYTHVLYEIGYSEQDANLLLSRAIFILDIFHVLDSHGLVLNMNGRVPDEGAMVEAGIAWNAGKKVVIYKSDDRTLIKGTDNPMLLGLADFVSIGNISEIPYEFDKLLSGSNDDNNSIIDISHLRVLYEQGARISHLTKGTQDRRETCHQLIEILRSKECANLSMKH